MEYDNVSYEGYLELKYQLTAELKILTENVNRLTLYVEKELDEQDKRIERMEQKLQGAKEDTKPKEGSSLPSNIKWLLVLILGIAFLGVLGAAIGVNLLQYLEVSQ